MRPHLGRCDACTALLRVKLERFVGRMFQWLSCAISDQGRRSLRFKTTMCVGLKAGFALRWANCLPTSRYPRQRLPEGRWDNLWLEAYTDEDVERVFSGFEPVLLVPSGDTWVDPEEFKKHSQPADAWQLREEFLRVEPSCESVLTFLNKWGRWNFMEFVDLAEILRLQGAVREALTDSPERWFQSPYSFPPTWGHSPEYPFFTFLTDQCEIAVRLTVTLDLLKGLKFTRCARPDCGQLFALGTRRVKKFCSRDCAHLEAVRRSRKKTERNGAEK